MRHNFVGRKSDLKQLEGHLYHIMTGQPRIVLLEGKAGVGKSRFLQEVQDLSHSAGIQVCSGHGSDTFSRPYQPFSGLFPALQSEGIFSDNQSSEIGLLQTTPSTVIDELTFHRIPSNQIRLMIDVTSASISLAREAPLMLIVDDLHLADDASLELFDYLACELIERHDVPILLLGSYRPTMSQAHLKPLLARLLKQKITREICLDNFDELETRDLIEACGHQAATQHLVDGVLSVTRGVPLYIEQLMLHFSHQGALVDQGGYLGLRDIRVVNSANLKTPEGMISPRLDALPAPIHDILTTGALLSDPISAEILASVTKATPSAIREALEVARDQGILIEQLDSFQFAHDLVRQLLQNRMSVVQCQQAHFNIAHALENLNGGTSDSRILVIAHHVIQAGSLFDVDHIVAVTQRAGDLAMKMYAWREAALYYEAALLAMESRSGYASVDLARYYYQAGVAHYRNQDVGPSWERFEQSVQVHTESGHKLGLAYALMWLTRLGYSKASTSFGVLPPHTQALHDVIRELDDSDPTLLGYLTETLSQAYRHGRLVNKANEMATIALSLAQEHHDPSLTAKASTALAMAHVASLDVVASIKHHLIAVESAYDSGDMFLQAHTLCNVPLPLCLKGDFDSAQSKAKEGVAVSRVLQDWAEGSKCFSHLAVVSAARGDFETVEQLTQEGLAMARRSGYPWGAYRLVQTWASTLALRELGAEEKDAAQDALDLITEPGVMFRTQGEYESLLARVLKQLALLYQGSMPTEPIAPLCTAFCQIARNDTYSLSPLCAIIELAELSVNSSMVEAPVKILSGALESGILFTSGWVFSIPRVLGLAAVLRKEWKVASAYFAQALRVTIDTKALPEYARTCLDYARMILLIGDETNYPEAIGLAKDAEHICREFGMSLHAKRGTRLKEALAFGMSLQAEGGTRLNEALVIDL